ncbi:hypothetical protein P0L94_16795 [Microbacter sp. GSS18]|nr:hypothetical protein P0L94_16795 [Microbacter sp. GSS18]
MSVQRRVLDRRLIIGASAIGASLVVGAAVLTPMAASGAVDLPDKTVEELIEFAGASDVDAFSGTIEQTSELGLPDLGALTGPMGDSGDGSDAADIDDLVALVTGSHTAKIYVDGDRSRLQVLDQLAERNVYVDGATEEVWFVDSESQTATRLTMTGHSEPGTPDPDALAPNPDDMLDTALARLDETTEVTVGTDARVAGREVYELILEPRTADTLIGQVRFAIDGQNGAALAMSITARGAQAPAFELAFTDVDFSAPDPAVFAFEPGAGMTVAEKDLAPPDGTEHGGDGTTPAATPVVIGEGWSTVVEMQAAPAGEQGALTDLAPEQLAMLESVTTEVDGGRALQTSLMSVLITDDGRVLAGSVPTSRLVEAAQTGR